MIYADEFGVIRWALKDAAAKWLQEAVNLFASRGWSWSYYSFRQKEYSGFSLEYDESFYMPEMGPLPAPPLYR